MYTRRDNEELSFMRRKRPVAPRIGTLFVTRSTPPQVSDMLLYASDSIPLELVFKDPPATGGAEPYALEIRAIDEGVVIRALNPPLDRRLVVTFESRWRARIQNGLRELLEQMREAAESAPGPADDTPAGS